VAHAQWFWENLGAYNLMQAQQPQTVAHAVVDSPAGLIGWNGQLFGDGVDRDFALTNIAIYWFTGRIASAMRFYYEDAKATPPAEPTTVPIGLAQFAGDFQSIRRFAERDHRNVASWHTYDRGGHYASHTATDLWVEDVTGFFGALK
jgi:epoxide hydrolase